METPLLRKATFSLAMLSIFRYSRGKTRQMNEQNWVYILLFGSTDYIKVGLLCMMAVREMCHMAVRTTLKVSAYTQT